MEQLKLMEVVSVAQKMGANISEKPWGWEMMFAKTDKYVGKIIYVKSGKQLSLQCHKIKDETMIFLLGEGHITIDNVVSPIARYVAYHIVPGAVHRVESDQDLLFVEVSTPEIEDVVRIEDDYGRA